MAWQTVGTSNDDMVDQLVALRVIKSDSSTILAAFRVTDRGDFVDTRRCVRPLRHSFFSL